MTHKEREHLRALQASCVRVRNRCKRRDRHAVFGFCWATGEHRTYHKAGGTESVQLENEQPKRSAR